MKRKSRPVRPEDAASGTFLVLVVFTLAALFALSFWGQFISPMIAFVGATIQIFWIPIVGVAGLVVIVWMIGRMRHF